jgi:hypothetical protein
MIIHLTPVIPRCRSGLSVTPAEYSPTQPRKGELRDPERDPSKAKYAVHQLYYLAYNHLPIILYDEGQILFLK